MAIEGTGAHCPHEIMRMGVRGSVAYPLRTRHVEARMAACGVDVDHAPRHRRTSTESPRLTEALHRRTRPVGGAWADGRDVHHGQGPWARALSTTTVRPWTVSAPHRAPQR